MAFQNGLRPAKELASNRPHGDRLKYLGGCRCVPCRAANSRYETERAAARRRGEWNGLVDASPVRCHLIRLSKREIGRDTVADITGIAASTIDLIRRGQRKKIRAMNARKILAISPDAVVTDAQRIPAEPTWRLIDWLLKQGFTKGEIASRLGFKSRALQLGKESITARNAMKIERFYRQIRAGDDEFKDTL